MQTVTPFLMFKEGGKQAVELYTTVFKNATISSMMTNPETGTLLQAAFSLNGQQFMAMDGGDHFSFAQGTSLFITCKSQTEVDYYWDSLTSDGGTPGRCGWLNDKFGVSWQVVPTALGELMSSGDAAASGRVMKAMLAMDKLIVADLKTAFQG